MLRLKNNKEFDSKIVARLRLTFALIVLGVIITAIIGGYLLADLAKTEQQSVQYSSSALDYSQELEQRLVRITDSTAKLGNENLENDIIALQTQLVEQTTNLRLFVETRKFNVKSIGDKEEKLVEALLELERQVEKSVLFKTSLLRNKQKIAANNNKVQRLRSSFNDAIKPISLDIATQLRNSVALLSTNKGFTKKLSSSDLVTQLDNQRQLLEISLRMSALMDSIELASPEAGDNVISDLISGVHFGFNLVTQYLANFEDDRSRREIATIIKDLHSVAIGDGGVLETIVDYRKNNRAFDEVYLAQLNQVENISSIIDAIFTNTKYEFTVTTDKFTEILAKLKNTSIVFGCVVLLFLTFINYYVVERQINQRMSKLTSAVIDIADGDIARKVNVEGTDEIGVIASSLEVFKRNAKELLRSNQELEQFAYSASHDLKSPLRAIENLAQWTLEDAGDELSEDSVSNLEKLLVRAKRLSQLQSDLLEYSKVGQQDNSLAKLDLKKTVEELSSVLNLEGRFSIVVNEPTETIFTQTTPLRQILLNLIDNAIKHHGSDSGQLEIAVRVHKQRLIVSVSDDGPGIAAEYHERIFGLFEKLESRDVVEGSGLGLSIVKRMVEDRDGSISIVSNPEKSSGTEFVFDWPIDYTLSTQKIAA